MIVLNEDILKTAVRMVLESSKPLKDIVDRYYSNVEPEKIEMAITLDPTTKNVAYNKDGTIDLTKTVKGRYFKWLMDQMERYYDDSACWQDDIEEALSMFDRAKLIHYKGINYDINAYDIQSLIDTMFAIDPNELQNGTEKSNQYNVLYSSNQWEIIEPYTYEASRHFGIDTSWCTAAGKNGYYNGQTMFNAYNEDYRLLINFDFNTGQKYQFAIPRDSSKDINQFSEFKDQDDVDILSEGEPISMIPEKIGMPSDVVQWYSNNFPNLWK